MSRPPLTFWTSISPGRYIVTKEFIHQGKPYKQSLDVNNPAYGMAVLKDWEDSVCGQVPEKQRSVA